jgi:chloramphenicol O-acetyltransferase type B
VFLGRISLRLRGSTCYTNQVQRVNQTGAYRRIVDPVRGAVRRWTHGDVVQFSPGPPYFFAEAPTYAPVRLVHHSDEDPPVRIGRYSSLNESVTFLPGGEHSIDTVSSFFFYYDMGVGEPEVGGSRGPITVGCDVWLGREVLVLSGVTIGDGAVVGARAVVTKDVAPFEIVGGVPARHIRWRFDEKVRRALLTIAWWNWPVEKVAAHQAQLSSRDIRMFIDLHMGSARREDTDTCAVCFGVTKAAQSGEMAKPSGSHRRMSRKSLPR